MPPIEYLFASRTDGTKRLSFMINARMIPNAYTNLQQFNLRKPEVDFNLIYSWLNFERVCSEILETTDIEANSEPVLQY